MAFKSYLQISDGSYFNPFLNLFVPFGAAINRIIWDVNSVYTESPGLSRILDDGRPLWNPFPSSIPTSVTSPQARVVLYSQPGSQPGKTLLDDVNATCVEAGGDIEIYWEYSSIINRNSPMIITVTNVLGLTDTQIDALFIAAAAA